MTDLRAIMEKLASTVATIQGNQGQLTVAVNRLQSDKLVGSISDKLASATAATSASAAADITAIRVQEMSAVGKVFLATFYMTGEASQWYTLLERNRGTPSWEEFT
jgi:hypothetical protein